MVFLMSSLLIKIDRCAVAGFLTAVAKIIFSSFSKPSPPSVPKTCNYLLLGARTVLLAKTVFYKDEDWTLQCKSHLVKPTVDNDYHQRRTPWVTNQ